MSTILVSMVVSAVASSTGEPRGAGALPIAEAGPKPTEPGILHPLDAQARFDYQRHVPDQRLAGFVENFWTITWDLSSQPPYIANVLPYPSVNLSVTNEEADVTGVSRQRYDRRLSGRGYVVGARFRPGCFRPLLGSSVSCLTDTHRPISEVLGRSTDELEQAVAATEDRAARVALLTDFLLEGPLPTDPVADQVAQLVDEIASRAELTRVSQVALRAQLSVRRLQRLFSDYVGASPKWVIIRCRLLDAAARAADAPPPDWAALAAELGFADQAHLTRTFSRTVGTPPVAYTAQQRSFR